MLCSSSSEHCTISIGLYYPLSTTPEDTPDGADTKLPAIVMELMQESVKSYIESAEQSNTILSYLSKLSILQDGRCPKSEVPSPLKILLSFIVSCRRTTFY